MVSIEACAGGAIAVSVVAYLVLPRGAALAISAAAVLLATVAWSRSTPKSAAQPMRESSVPSKSAVEDARTPDNVATTATSVRHRAAANKSTEGDQRFSSKDVSSTKLHAAEAPRSERPDAVSAHAEQPSTPPAAATAALATEASPVADKWRTDLIACPAGFDADIFASLPIELQREAVRTAEKKAKLERAAEERKAKQAAKVAKQAAAGSPSTSMDERAVTNAKSQSVSTAIEVCGVSIPGDCEAESLGAQMASFRLNALLAELRVVAGQMAEHVENADMPQLYMVANALMKLQMQFDNVDVKNDDSVRATRKACVKSLNALLDVAEGLGWQTSAR